MATCYVPLRSRSNGSLLRGASPPAAYLARAAEWGLPALALTDDNLLLAVPFFEEARRFGVRPLLGATLREGEPEAVLLVEDEPGARVGIRAVLTRLDYEVTAVGSGAEAEALPVESGFDVLLADIVLPDISGAALSRRLQERWPDLVVVPFGLAHRVAPAFAFSMNALACW